MDVEHTGQVIAAGGPWLVLAILPFALAQAFDTHAWQLVFARLSVRVGLRELYPVRVAVEAMTVSMPAGVVVAESVAPRLLEQTLGVTSSATLAAAGARRWLTMRACVVAVHEHPGGLASLRYAPVIVLASAFLPLGASLAVSMTLSGGSRATRLFGLLSRVPLPALQRWLVRRRDTFVRTDAGFVVLARKEGSLLAPTAWLVVAWLFESVEAFVLLHIAGARLSFVEVLSFEAGLSVLRSAWFFAPAGLGGLDLGYMAVLHALGVAEATAVGATFLVLKRGRELLWVGLGYAWMALRRRHAPTQASTPHGFPYDAPVALGPAGD